MTGAIVFTWGAPARGRESKGIEVFGKALTYFEDLAKRGRIHGHREYFTLTGDTGNVSGLMIIDGELEELLRLQGEEDYRRLLFHAQAIVEQFTVRVCTGGSDRAVQEGITQYVETLQGLGYWQ